MKTQIHLQTALNVFKELEILIGGYCDKFYLAGSARRKQIQVGDIEIVCLPSMSKTYKELPQYNTNYKVLDNGDLFGTVTRTQNIYENPTPGKKVIHPKFIERVESFKKVKGDATGRYTQRILPITDLTNNQEITVDFFMPSEHDFYRQLTIRTGDVNFVKTMIAFSWSRLGWCGTENGLRRKDECIKKSNKWICVASHPTLAPSWKSEKDFFSWLGINYVEPEKRHL